MYEYDGKYYRCFKTAKSAVKELRRLNSLLCGLDTVKVVIIDEDNQKILTCDGEFAFFMWYFLK